ncbi:MAG: hypothetical protein JWN66_4239 [Sphingomonas bacterium]|uniref:TraB/GumN family protein n=1 Tax=Sphingomonas bacterium TaxID=1895847 RepID=UPI00262BB5A7|nr:TraB/GumN family protein [Sphingomonas bacterium]MDB5707123.1 hypothetical protein [Sphingomonas bacterium]
MARDGPAGAPASGFGAGRGAFGLGLALSLLIAAPAAAQRIPYPVIQETNIVTLRGHRVGPRIPYPPLPPDERIAPDDFALDYDEADMPSPEEIQAAEARIALAQLSQNYRPRPAIWKIADRDTTIYLFGTIHILPPGFQWRSTALDQVVASAGTLIVESVDNRSSVESLMSAPTPALSPLTTRVSPDHKAALTRFTDTLAPQATAALDGMPTWITAVAVGYVRDFRSGEIPGPGADDWLEAQFRQARKPVVAIEDGEKVFATVNAIPEAEQRRMLDLALDAPQRSRAELRAPMHAWAKGEVGPRSALTVDMVGSSGTEALSAPLLADRNRAWADSLVRRLRTPGTALFAAGAGHFVGPDSVLDLLRQRGIKVKRVE